MGHINDISIETVCNEIPGILQINLSVEDYQHAVSENVMKKIESIQQHQVKN